MWWRDCRAGRVAWWADPRGPMITRWRLSLALAAGAVALAAVATALADGLMAARLAANGFTANPDIIEAPQGVAEAYTTTFNPDRAASNAACSAMNFDRL